MAFNKKMMDLLCQEKNQKNNHPENIMLHTPQQDRQTRSYGSGLVRNARATSISSSTTGASGYKTHTF